MQSGTTYRVIRAAVLTGLAALTLSTHVFVSLDRVRVKVLEASTLPTGGQVRVSTTGPQVNELRPPFALIARIKTGSGRASAFTIAVDGRPMQALCGRWCGSTGRLRCGDCVDAGRRA
jgi:hypothetical protein